MAQRLLLSIGITMIAMAMLSSRVSAQTSGCMITIISLSPCLNYITTNSSSTIPPSSCCSTLSSVIKNEPQCFCMLNSGGAPLLGVALNNTKITELPLACLVQTPDSLCRNESTTTGESSDAMSNKSPVISIFFLIVSALASMI